MRHRFLSHPVFQATFTFWFVFGILLIVGVLGGSAWATLTIVANSIPLTEYQQVVMRSSANQLLSYLGLTAVILGFSGFIFAIYLSFRFVGPLTRVETWLETHLGGGKQVPLKIRKRDELSKTAQLLQRIIEKQRRRAS